MHSVNRQLAQGGNSNVLLCVPQSSAVSASYHYIGDKEMRTMIQVFLRGFPATDANGLAEILSFCKNSLSYGKNSSLRSAELVSEVASRFARLEN